MGHKTAPWTAQPRGVTSINKQTCKYWGHYKQKRASGEKVPRGPDFPRVGKGGAASGGPGSLGTWSSASQGTGGQGLRCGLSASWARLRYKGTEDPLVGGDVDISRNQKNREQQVATLERWGARGPSGVCNERVKGRPCLSAAAASGLSYGHQGCCAEWTSGETFESQCHGPAEMCGWSWWAQRKEDSAGLTPRVEPRDRHRLDCDPVTGATVRATRRRPWAKGLPSDGTGVLASIGICIF